MKNKRNPFARLLSVVMLLSLCCLFTACPSDSEEKDEDTGFDASFNIQELINHKWKSTDVSSGQGKYNDNQIWLDIDTYYLYFKSDKTGVLSMILKDYDTVLGNTTQQEYILFKYTVSGNIITVTMENGSTTKYTYMGEYLQDSSGTIYTPVTMSAGDYEYLSGLGPKTGSCGSGLTYSYDERSNELVISGTGRMNDYTTTNQPWHDFSINKVTINEGCTYIGSHAFHGLKYYFTELELPNSVQEIGNQAFSGTLISSLLMPTSIVRIGNEAFSGCKGLKKVNFSGCDNLEEIGDYAFYSSPVNLGYFTLPVNVRKVGDFAFSTSDITKLTLNDGLETVGLNAFSELKQSQLIIPNSVKSIGHLAFHGSFNEIRVGTGLSSLGGVPFLGAYTGKLYLNQSKPLTLSKDFIMNNDGNNAATSWTLYVPKGCKSAYQKATGWKSFKSIVEDSSLEGGSSGSEGNDNQGDNNNGDNNNDNDDGNNDTPSGDSHTGTNNGHEYVDLGLPSGTLWATCNVGASKPEGYGDYYAWGETETNSKYVWVSYKYGRSDDDVDNIGSDIAGTSYDVAHVKWGGTWRMPTMEQFAELAYNTTPEWTTQKSVKGCKFTGTNGASIFLPAAGIWMTSLLDNGNRGYYWSSTLETTLGKTLLAYPNLLIFYSGKIQSYNCARCEGLSVRPVCQN